MRISRPDAVEFFDHFGFIDLWEKKYIPAMELARRKRLDGVLTAHDYEMMERDPERYLRPPVRNPMFIDFTAALQAGVPRDVLLRLGYDESDAHRAFISREELDLLLDAQKTSDARHALRDCMSGAQEDDFCRRCHAVAMETITDWLASHGVEVV